MTAGAKVIATAFDDLGYEVIVGPLFQTPAEAARLGIEEDVDILGVSSHAAGHMTLAPMLIKELADNNAADKIVICGGVIPPQDYEFLKQAGVAAIYGPGTNILESATGLIGLLREQMRGRNRLELLPVTNVELNIVAHVFYHFKNTVFFHSASEPINSCNWFGGNFFHSKAKQTGETVVNNGDNRVFCQRFYSIAGCCPSPVGKMEPS